jgi:hypothetical protein
MPWFLNPRIYENLPAYQNPELYLFIFKVAATAIFALLLRKQGMSLRRLWAIAFVFFYGVFLTVMLFAHNFVILGLRIFEPSAKGYFTYDFHLYSLILLGAVIFLQGVRTLRAALLLKAGDDNGIRAARRASWIVLAVAVPLIPIQFFGIVLTIFSLLNLAAIKLFLSSPAVTKGECPSLHELQALN